MSLTQDIANMVQAANNLTAEVAGKMNQIDSKVNNAVNEITETITANNVVTYYVDAVDGNDSNSGSSGSPLKTIKRAMTICPTGSTAKLYLKRNQRHVIDSNVRCYALSVEILPINYNTDTSGAVHYDASTPVIEWAATVTSSGGLFIGGFKQSLIVEVSPSGQVEFYSNAGKFTLARSKIIIDRPNYKPFIGDEFDYLNVVKVSLRDATVVKTSGYLARRGCILSADAVTGASTIEELVYGANRDNTLTNMNFAS
ncbi:TPA: hypothetical protein ACMDRM_001684 [Vibrio cholerae]